MLELGFLAYSLGFIASVVLPYIQAYLADPTITFDWRYLVSRLAGSLVPLLLLVTSPDTKRIIEIAIESNLGSNILLYLFIFATAYGSAEIGQFSRKSFNTVVNREQIQDNQNTPVDTQ